MESGFSRRERFGFFCRNKLVRAGLWQIQWKTLLKKPPSLRNTLDSTSLGNGIYGC